MQGQELNIQDPWGSLPTQDVLCFYDFNLIFKVKQGNKMCSYLVLGGKICLNTHSIRVLKFIITISNNLEKICNWSQCSIETKGK